MKLAAGPWLSRGASARYLACSLALSGCGAPAIRDGGADVAARPSAIVGANDLVVVAPPFASLPDPVRNAALATGLLSSPCTVTHLGGGLAVTAAHCVPAEAIGGCAFLTVRWDDPALGDAAVPCREVTLRLFGSGVDMAILRFDAFPAARVRIATGLQNPSALAGRALTVLSHPGGGPLRSSGTCGAVVTRDRLDGRQFGHSCDTTSGSSGAGVLDALTGELVGIHSAGVTGGSAGPAGAYNLATFARAMNGGVILP